MRSFVVKAFDAYVSGTTNVYSPNDLAEQLGGADSLCGSVLVVFPSGTGPTLTIQMEHSFDGTRWTNLDSQPELPTKTLVSGEDSAYTFKNNDTIPMLSHVRLRIVLGGTSPSANVQVWLCGRNPGS